MKSDCNTSIFIEGVKITGLRQIEDDRGAVLHMLRSDEPEFTAFGECYFSEVKPHVVKGWKCHREQTQNLAVPIGRIKFVIYDNRSGSSTAEKLQELELGRPDAYFRLRIPPGLWYGFECLGESPALLVNCADKPHNQDECDTLSLDDASIPYKW